MLVALGTTRKPKVDAVRESLRRIGGPFAQDPQLACYEVKGAPRMPLQAEELIQGAIGRAQEAFRLALDEGVEADYAIGMEGGFDVRTGRSGRRLVLLESWAYVTDGNTGFLGQGGGIQVPESLAGPVIDEGRELGWAADRFSGQTDIRSKQGTWGLLTRDLHTRTESFVVALIAAWAPFYNSGAYGSTSP